MPTRSLARLGQAMVLKHLARVAQWWRHSPSHCYYPCLEQPQSIVHRVLQNVGTGCGGTRPSLRVEPRRLRIPPSCTHETAPWKLHSLSEKILRLNEAEIYSFLKGMQRLILSPWVGCCYRGWFLASLRGKAWFFGADFFAKSGYKSPGLRVCAMAIAHPLPLQRGQSEAARQSYAQKTTTCRAMISVLSLSIHQAPSITSNMPCITLPSTLLGCMEGPVGWVHKVES